MVAMQLMWACGLRLVFRMTPRIITMGHVDLFSLISEIGTEIHLYLLQELIRNYLKE